MKQCTKCKIYKEESSFRKNKKTKKGIMSICRNCSNELQRLNSPKYRENKNKRTRARYLENLEKMMLKRTKYKCEIEDIPFNLELSDIIIPEYCPILEVKMIPYTYTAASIDRIVPELGYTKGNIWIISRKANVMKNDANLKELEIFCKNIKEKILDPRNLPITNIINNSA